MDAAWSARLGDGSRPWSGLRCQVPLEHRTFGVGDGPCGAPLHVPQDPNGARPRPDDPRRSELLADVNAGGAQLLDRQRHGDRAVGAGDLTQVVDALSRNDVGRLDHAVTLRHPRGAGLFE